MEALTPAAQLMSTHTTDPAEFELALRPWELLCRPRSFGDFRHMITGVKTAKFIIYRERFSTPVHVQGVSPRDTLVIGAPIYTGREARYWGAPYSGSSLPSTLPGPLDVALDAGHYHQVAIIDLPFLRASLSEEIFEQLVRAMRTRFLMVPSEILKNYMDWGARLLKVAQKAPSLIQDATIINTLRQELLQHLSLISGEGLLMRDRNGHFARQRGFLRAMEYMRGDFKTLFSMADICKVAGISERSLQYAFRENFDMTPYQFMKRRRFHAARQALVTESQNVKSVSQVAMEYGFYELGRFSVEYRQLFGELPSKTKARRAATAH